MYLQILRITDPLQAGSERNVPCLSTPGGHPGPLYDKNRLNVVSWEGAVDLKKQSGLLSLAPPACLIKIL